MLENIIDRPMGINYNSPAVNYTMGGMYNIPPNPIGGIPYGSQPYGYQVQQPTYQPQPYGQQSMGGYQMRQPQPYGYQQPMGGYNNGVMGGYYGAGGYMANPYIYQQQMRAQEAAMKEQERRQSDFMKGLSTLAHKSLGDIDDYENFEEHLKQYDPITIDKEAYEEELHYNKMCNLKPAQPNYAAMAYMNKVQEDYRKRFPSNMSLYDFLDNAGTIILENVYQDSQRLNRDGKLQYNTDQYRQILASHRGISSYLNSALTTGIKSINIDDMEIELPQNPGERSRIVVTAPATMQVYNERKAAFFNALMQNASMT